MIHTSTRRGNRSGADQLRQAVHIVFQGLTAVAAVAALVLTARSLDYTADATNANRAQHDK
ncbi:hypothetical protein ACQEUR_14205 [Plantactinospora sp. CA-290183]